MSRARLLKRQELPVLLELYQYLHATDAPPPSLESVERIWARGCEAGVRWWVCEVDEQLVASCTLAIISNLTRGCRPYGVVENVVTHGDFRRRGYGREVVTAALQAAWQADCYKVMLLTGRHDPGTLAFYQRCGFETGAKIGLLARPD